jgi:endonuclease YncB( thermonuclease family)
MMHHALALTFLALCLGGFSSLAKAHDMVQGRAKVISGDTLAVAGQRIRLHGIDAPEFGQPCHWPNKTIDCGNISRTGLLDLIAPVEISCRRRATAADGTWIARCVAEDFDVGRNMVHTGWAMALPGDPAGYLPIQIKAQAAKRGMWRGTFVPPWEWRRSQ